MVDLVKIRKKAKKKESLESGGLPPASEVAQPEVPEMAAASRRTPEKLEKFISEAGTKREGFIHEAAVSAASSETEVLTFVLAGEHYAVHIEHILEITRPRATTRVPNAAANVVGITSLRGLIVTLLDLRARLHHPPAPSGADARIIVVEHDGETLGFEVDRVLRVVKLDAGAVEPQPVVHSSEQSDAIRGVFTHGGALTILLDLDKLLA